MFNEVDVIRIEHFARGRIPKSISLRMRSIAYQDTRYRVLEDLWIVGEDEHKGLAANFM